MKHDILFYFLQIQLVIYCHSVHSEPGDSSGKLCVLCFPLSNYVKWIVCGHFSDVFIESKLVPRFFMDSLKPKLNFKGRK